MNLLFSQNEHSSLIDCIRHKTKKAIKQTDKGFFKAYGVFKRIVWNYEPLLIVKIEEPRGWMEFLVFEDIYEPDDG